MPVLLLAQGDAPSKDMLRKAIDARYGLRPPALETLKVKLNGSIPARIGPIKAAVNFEATTYFSFSRAMRWDFRANLFGIQVSSGREAFDGVSYHGKATSEDSQLVMSMKHRLWAVAALLLTPIGEQFSKIRATGEYQLTATHTQLGSEAMLQLRPGYLVESVSTTCFNPATKREQVFKLLLSDKQISVNDLILPSHISAFWDAEPYFEAEPTQAEVNPTIADNVFTTANA